LTFTLATLGAAASSLSAVAPTVAGGAAVGVVATYMASPPPAQCDGNCQPYVGDVCGLNGQNYDDKCLTGSSTHCS
jgi:hypothetical protein